MLELLERLLDRLAVVRHVRIPEPVHDDVCPGSGREELLSARPRLGFPVALRSEHHPRHLDGALARQGEQRPTAPDLDVVRDSRSPARDGAARRRRRARARASGRPRLVFLVQPDLTPGRAAGLVEPFQPLSILDRVHRPEEALVRERHHLSAGNQGANVSSTSSSPGSIQSSSSLRHTKKPPLILTSE